MNIWLINHYANLVSQGPSTRHYFLAKELSTYGHNVSVIASSRLHNKKSELLDQGKSDEIQRISEEGIEFLLLPTPPYKGNVARLWNMLTFSFSLLAKFKKFSDKRPDVVIGSSIHPFAAWAAERIASYYKVPFIFEVRDLWPQTLVDMKALSPKHPLTMLLRYLEKYLYLKATKIITLLPYSHEYITRYKINPSKIQYLPNGVDLDMFSSAVGEEQSRIDDSSRDLVVMYLGAHGPANGLETLVMAAKELEEANADLPIKWRLIGDGPNKKKLQELSKSLGLKSLFFEEPVPKIEVPDLIKQADLLVFHLLQVDVFKYGISPNKLFDYMAAGKPIVFACHARNNLVEASNSGISIAPESPSAMAEAVLRLASLSSSERLEMGLRGRSYVIQNHSYRKLASDLNGLLEKLN